MTAKNTIDPPDNLHGEQEDHARFPINEKPGGVYDERHKAPAGNPSDPRGEYDPQTTPMGDSSDPRSSEKKLSSEELADKEAKALGGATSKASSSEESKIGGGLYSGEENDENSAFKRFRGKLNRKSITGIIVGGVLIFGGAGLFSVLQGPLQLVHLSQILQLPFSNQDDASEKRLGRLIAYARTGEVGETRVSWLGSRSTKKSYARLAETGFKVDGRSSGGGRVQKVTIDISKYSPGENTRDFARNYAATNGIPDDFIKYDPVSEKLPNGTIEVSDPSGKPLPNKLTRDLHRQALYKRYGTGTLGKTITAFKLRPVVKYNGSYTKLHVIRNLQTKTLEATAKWDEARKAKKIERNTRTKERLSSLKDKVNKVSKPTAAIAGMQLVLCVARDIAHDVPLASYENVQLPSRNEALEFISLGSQIQAGDDFFAAQPGQIVKGMTDKNGESFWSGKALDAMANKSEGKGTDIDEDVRGGFSSRSFAADVESALNSVAGGDYICSATGQLIGAGIGIVALIGAAPTGGASIAAYSVFAAGSAAVSVVAISAATSLITRLVDGEPLAKDVAGAYGGNLVAYGARDMANEAFRTSGGAAIPDSNNQILTASVQEAEDKKYASKGLTQKLFDLKDYRSVASQAIDKSPSKPQENIARLASSSLNLSSLASGLLGIFNGKASAQDAKSYDWGFPLYGFTDQEIENSAVEDPYDNADRAAELLKNNGSYRDRAKTCFGVQFEDDDNGKYRVQLINNPDGDPEKAIIPSSADYKDAKCNDDSENWLRIRMFVFDSRTMEAYACFESDESDPENKNICEDFDSSSVATAVPAAETATEASDPPDKINGYTLTAREKKHLKYIAENVVSKLNGSPEKQAEIAAQSAWWSLRESVLDLEDPFGYSNCSRSNTHIGVVDSCSADVWQVGIGAVQVPNFSNAQVVAAARKYNPGKSTKEILAQVSVLAGYNEGDPIYNQIVNSTGTLQRSLLLRDPPTGIALVNQNVQPCFGSSPEAWCRDGKPELSAGNNIKKSVDELKAYFMKSVGDQTEEAAGD